MHLLRALMAAAVLLASPIQARASPSDIVRKVLAQNDDKLDYLSAKTEFDSLIDSHEDNQSISDEISRLISEAERIAVNQSDSEKLDAVIRVIYESGPWNRDNPFAYDQENPLGRKLGNKLLGTYLSTHRGNCVSMPVLFAILADKMGVPVAFATAPLHLFVRYAAPGGAVNIEATSGGYPARDSWYQQNLQISERAIASGLYMHTLSRREGVAHMASDVVDYLIERGQYREAVAVSDIILENYPLDGYVMVKRGSAIGQILQSEFIEKYRYLGQIPLPRREEFRKLTELNRLAFERAEELGWTPVE